MDQIPHIKIGEIVVLYLAILCCFNTTYSQEEVFVPYISVGNMVIGESTFKECKKEFPNAEYDKYWESSPGIAIGNFVKEVTIDAEGKIFFFTKKRRLGKYYLESVRLTKNYKGKMSGGIGIGSTYSQIIKKFGTISRIGSDRVVSELGYFKYGGGTRMILFVCYNSKADSTNFVIDAIYME